MRALFRASVLYLFATLGLTAALTRDPIATVDGLLRAASSFAGMIGGMVVQYWPLILLCVVLLGPRRGLDRLPLIVFAAASAFFIQVGFLFAKSAIPQMIPFYADAFFAQADRTLLMGHDAWVLAHRLTPESWVAYFPMIYMPVWAVVAIGFPVLVVLSDPDKKRMVRYSWLFFICWIVVGNIAATLGSSVGPVYYDRLLGTERFDDLRVALDASGFAQSSLGQLQDSLWTSREQTEGLQISSISAFPSMHVSVATILALYVLERFPKFAVFGFGFLAVISLISVYSGYHYVLDSIAGCVMTLGLGWVMRRHAARAQDSVEATSDLRNPAPAV